MVLHTDNKKVILIDEIYHNQQKVVVGWCYHSVNVISLALTKSDHIKRLSLYYIL